MDISQSADPQISDLLPGMRLYGAEYAITSVEEIDARGFKFLAIGLSDATGQVRAVLPNYTPGDLADLRSGDIACVWGDVDRRQRYLGQINITECIVRRVSDGEDAERFMQPLPEGHEETRKHFWDIASLEAPWSTRLIRAVIDRAPDYFTATAARRMHHAYRGGLVTHSVEVARICVGVCRIIPSLNRSLLVTAALLHDVGKTVEMEHGLRRGRYTVCGELVGHIVSGALAINEAAAAIGLDGGLRVDLMHLILSHHGRREHGAAVEPQTPEAWALAMADQMSAQVDKYQTGVSVAPGRER